MAFLLPFIPLIAAGVGAAGLADTIYNQVNAPGQPAPTPQTPQPQGAALDQAQKALIGTSASNTQAATSGFASPDYTASIGATDTGLLNNPQAAGNIQAAINQLFGFGAPGQGGLTPSGSQSGNSITDLIQRATAAQGGGAGAGAGSDFRGFS